MNLDDIKKIGVIGAGAMGAQIAEVLTRIGGYEATITDISDEMINKGITSIDNRLEKFFVAKGKITAEEKSDIMSRIIARPNIEEAVKDVDCVIEAVPEVLSIKQDTFKQLDAYAPEGILLATNTSTLSVTDIASGSKYAAQIVGMHFFNPVAVMKLVEVVTGAHTSQEAIDLALALSKKLGKDPVVCRDTSYGFLANRMYDALREEALQIVWEKVACPEDVDKSLKLGYNLPRGPLELGDMLGSWKRRVEMKDDKMEALGPVKGQVHPLIKEMVRAGYYGGPGNKGVYDFWKEVLSKW